MTKIIKIRDHQLGYDQPVFVIAEAGVNHNQKLDLALKLIDAAADAGADAVKFQTAHAEQVVTATGEMAEYQKKNIGKSESQLEMVRKLLPPDDWYPKLIAHAKKRGIIFFSTPHGSFASVDLLEGLGVPAFKFGSGDLTNLPLLAYAAKLGKPIILGTGMATTAEVKEAVRTIYKAGNEQVIALHCTTNYPCGPEEVNLRAMQTMMKELPCLVGYSDHTLGSQVSVMATALGACVIEKHLTLDNNLPGPDHAASANPALFKQTVEEIRKAGMIMGSAVKKPGPNELQYIPMVRRSIVATKDIKRGEKFSRKNIDLKRPGTGLPPKAFDKIVGRIAARNITADSLIKKSDTK
ncbi:MAG: N-acetylneuraminate synthase [Candidatus Yanofskybacteria bacterium RIFCSPHIGHO2_01_FULL_43_42]|uniref:N-acetylneuraminate synthase n=1 Tax=Candidatus Yanofskybacteria bacterium RIFCSPLOWO2_01_FULL_43_22 TaxID=1802695 RepID=A0A1F8GHW6_9BACT|nr:MAG: N-acetylneuraminate synthase [Candidatus Yanofskybacteria bacterium RIFCSPHIGHO2_01_FULL_43_42]OGN13224.1 MAG: N-acetylneuraminate synthase [Candidatus Yanofskybacteria bacterium RIFCSPHIGHO2_02_FULL_43_17]OGN24640.1 MAG: N-acetylneuraminate synthase [Candidatus Yanofskybacteria bacterium RIFCSPLOWO2_01_FULL_43_22]